MRFRSGEGCLTCSLEESKLLKYFYLISFVVVKSPVIDDRDMFSPANQFKRRWRMETEVGGKKQLISLRSARVMGAWSCHFHSLCYLLFSSAHNSIHTSLLRSSVMLDLCPDLQFWNSYYMYVIPALQFFFVIFIYAVRPLSCLYSKYDPAVRVKSSSAPFCDQSCLYKSYLFHKDRNISNPDFFICFWLLDFAVM